MPSYRAPVEDTNFVLNDVLNYQRYNNLPGFAEAAPDVVEAILSEGAKLAEGTLFPVNQTADREGCTRHADGSVTTPKGYKEAYNLYREGGWLGLAVPEQYGGQGLPYLLHTAVGEYMSSANMALTMYPGLTQGAIAAILTHGTDEQKDTYLPKMVEGTWTGTMNLTEPHCGTDLGSCAPALCRKPMALTRSPARRFLSRLANTTCRKTSSIWCWPVSRARRKA